MVLVDGLFNGILWSMVDVWSTAVCRFCTEKERLQYLDFMRKVNTSDCASELVKNL